MNLLVKGAIETVPPAQSESGFYSCYFLVPKKDGGLWPILDLRRLNWALMGRPFRMTTLKQILSQVCPGDWFFSLDLKDAYIHIQIAPHHRRFLRFVFEGLAYMALPFGLSLAPRTFTKCIFSDETDGNPHSKWPQRLAHLSPVGGWIGHAPGNGLQKEGGLNRCFLHRLGCAGQRQTGFRPLVKAGGLATHHCPYMGSTHSAESPPFELLQSTLSLKTALQLVLALVNRIGDLQALSVSPTCLKFGPSNSKVILKPKHGYVPKVLSTPFRAQVITLSAPSGRWEFISSVPPHSGKRNSSLFASAAAPRGFRSESRNFPNG